MGHVGSNGTPADHQRFGDFPIRAALRQQTHNIPFSARQRIIGPKRRLMRLSPQGLCVS
jgi:hypothetical protein